MWTKYWSLVFTTQLGLVHGLGVLNAVHAALDVRVPQAALGWPRRRPALDQYPRGTPTS
jgi:hypothetical protein